MHGCFEFCSIFVNYGPEKSQLFRFSVLKNTDYKPDLTKWWLYKVISYICTTITKSKLIDQATNLRWLKIIFHPLAFAARSFSTFNFGICRIVQFSIDRLLAGDWVSASVAGLLQTANRSVWQSCTAGGCVTWEEFPTCRYPIRGNDQWLSLR